MAGAADGQDPVTQRHFDSSLYAPRSIASCMSPTRDGELWQERKKEWGRNEDARPGFSRY